MATSPLNRFPSTTTGQSRSAPPTAKRTTPSQRMASPSRVQNSFRSVQAGRKAASTPIGERAAMTQRLPRSSRTPGLMFPPTKSDAPAMTKTAAASAISAGWEKKAAGPPPAEDGQAEIGGGG